MNSDDNVAIVAPVLIPELAPILDAVLEEEVEPVLEPELQTELAPDGSGVPPRFCCFVTGTDTEIGKTLTTSAMLHALVQRGVRACGMKPVAAGADMRDGLLHNDDADQLAAAGNVSMLQSLTTPYMLKEPAAPHIAAALEGVRIESVPILAAYTELAAASDAVVVEGVGGFCVPLADDFDTADLARQLGLPVVLVVGLRLGCINHALLTAQAIRARGLALAGWVGNTVDATQPHQADNLTALADRLNAPCWGVVPRLGGSAPGAADVASHLNTAELHTALLA